MDQLADHAAGISRDLWLSAMPSASWDLSSWGVTLVVSLSEQLPPQAARRFEWGTAGEATGEGRIVFLHWPIADGDLPDMALTDVIVQATLSALRGGGRVLVHCQEGRNRSGLIAALVVRELFDVTREEAVRRVRAARPGMLANRAFVAHINSLPAPGSRPNLLQRIRARLPAT